MATLFKEKPKQRKKKDGHKSVDVKSSSKEEAGPSSTQPHLNDELVDILKDSSLKLPDQILFTKEINTDETACKDVVENDKISSIDNVQTDEAVLPKKVLQPENLRSKTEHNETIKNLDIANNAFKDVNEAAKVLIKDISKLKLDKIQEYKSTKVKSADDKPLSFSLEDIGVAFGVKEIVFARNYITEFKLKEYQPVSNRHILFEMLMSYKLARNQLRENNDTIKRLKKESADKISVLWKISNHTVSSQKEICIHQKKFSFDETHQKATLAEKDLSHYAKIGVELREKVTESHSVFSHSEHVLKIQIDDLLWRASLSVETIIESLRIIFWVILTTGRGPDTHYNKQLTDWCLFLGTELLRKEPLLKNTLFILHHLLRLPQNLSWSYSLIQCQVSSIADVSTALALLETILLSRKIVSHNAGDKPAIAESKESTDDDNTWLVVDLGEETPDAELMVADGSTLRESDILGLIGQIPFDQIFKELMFVKSNGYELIFCGANLSPELVLKIFCGARIAFPIIKGGFQLYGNYRKLSNELCKLTHQFVMYCTDLWEATRTKWNETAINRICVEYDNLFKTAWATLDSCAFKDVAAMFQSLLPFSSVPEATLNGMFVEITRKVIVFDQDQCYRTLETLSNMALVRREPEFVLRVTKYLFDIGFTSENSFKACGGVARTLCGTILKHHSILIGEILLDMTKATNAGITPQGEWIESLPLLSWRPIANQLMTVLKAWNISCQQLLPYLIQNLDCNSRSGLSLCTQRDVAVFLAGVSQSFIRQKLPIPSWIFDCLISLRIHAVDWGYALESAPEPESLESLEISEFLLGSTNSACSRCHASALVVLAATTWGHSLPLLYQKGVLLLIRLANAGRHREVVHILYYAIVVLTQSPEDVKDSPSFKELLSTLLNSDKSYAKMATRFITGDVPGPIAKLLIDLIKTQMTQFEKLLLPSPAPVLSVWLQWLMSLDNWSSDFSVLYLADTVISCCFNDGHAMGTAFEIFKNYIQDNITSTGGSGLWGGNWFFGGGGSPFKGVIQCPSAEVPLLWLITMQAEHAVLERGSGLWTRLLVKLVEKQEGKVNVDKALKSVGGQDSSAGLTLYRAAQYAVITPVTHPYHTIMWQFFFSLYLDTSALEYSQQLRPIGHLFFRGVVNSRLLTRLRSRLDDARAHHEMQHKRYTKMAIDKTPNTDSKGVSRKDSVGNYLDEYSQRAEFHRNQTMHMDAFKLWLDEEALQKALDGQIASNSSQFMFAKMESLIQGRYYPWMDTIDNFESRKHTMARWPSVLLHAKPKLSQDESSLPTTPVDSPADVRILERLKEAARDRIVEDLKCSYSVQPVLGPTVSAKEAITLANNALVNIKQFDILYSNAQNALTAEDNIVQRLIVQMYKERVKNTLIRKHCLEQNCPGVQLTLQYKESYLDNSVMEQINNNRVAFNATLQKLIVSFDGLAKMTEILISVAQLPWAAHRDKLSPNQSSSFFFTVLEASSSLNCLPLRDAVSTAASKLGTVFVSKSGPQCSALIRRCRIKVGESEGLSHERRAAVVGSLLRPLDLPAEEFVDVYRTIITDVLDPHISFSFLSKFDVTVWLKLHNPLPELITEFLSLLVHKLVSSGPKPPSQDMVVQELLCVHLCRTLQWSWPLHLPEVLKEMSQLACDDQLPPEIWEHIAKLIEANSDQMQLHCCTACGISLGLSFESGRRRRAPRATWQGTAQAVHASAVARIGAAISAAATAAAMLHQPTIMADKIAHIVFKISCSIFDPWLVPWWGASCRSSPGEEPQMPWGLPDAKLVEVIFDAFVESMLYVVNTLPGSEVALLRCIWSWYVWHYQRYNPHHPQTQSWQILPDYIIILTHQQLARLPWHLYSWVALHEMESIIGLCGRPHFNEFAAHCLRGLRSDAGSWDWVSGQMHCLNLVIFTLISLPLDQKIIDDVTDYLPWRNLDCEFFKEVLRRFFSSLSASTEILCQHRLIRLLCAAAGLRATVEAHPLQKKLALVEQWARYLDRKSKKNVENIGLDLTSLLSTIESGSKATAQDNEDNFISEGDLATCKLLFEVTVGLLNVESLRDHILQDWTQFLSKCNQLSSRAIVCCTIKLDNKDVYSLFSESALDAYFRNGDDWNRLLVVWKSSSFADLEFLVKSGSLISAFVSLSCIQKDLKSVSILLNKNMLKALKDTSPSSKNEKGIILWAIFILELVSMDSPALFGEQFETRSQLLLLVKQWSEEQGWGILKAIGLAQNTAPSQRFHVVMTYLQTIKLFVTTSKQEVIAQLANPTSQQSKIIKSLEYMVHQKSCFEFKSSVTKCVEWAKNITFLDEWKTNLQNLCKELYPNYVHLYQYKL